MHATPNFRTEYKCGIEYCRNKRYTKGVCITHLATEYPEEHQRLLTRRRTRKCRAEGCLLAQKWKGYCQTHCKEFFPDFYDRQVAIARERFAERYRSDALFRKVHLEDTSKRRKKFYDSKRRHKPEYIEKRRLELKNNKAIVFQHYSNGTMKCACCNESIFEFLSIDHMNGRTNKDDLTGHQFYRWLIRSNFPEGYRVLCNNCNQVYGHYGYCPHNR